MAILVPSSRLPWGFWAWVLLHAVLPPPIVLGIEPDDTIPEYMAKYGIRVETHAVITEDGYNLTAFRLARPGAPVVLLQHGILASSWCWLDNDPAIAPAFQIYYLGYDVWLTNTRGNTFSRRHTHLSPILNRAFWDFSFADMGRHDVPANIQYILEQTGKATLVFVGHSQGTSQFFVAMTDAKTKEFLEQTVSLFVAVAPVTYMAHQASLLIKVLNMFHIGELLETTWPFGFLQWTGVKYVDDFLCSLTGGLLCEVAVSTVCGTSQEDVPDAITNISAHFPAGTSVKSLNHYAQLVVNGRFQDYDYGEQGNLKKYGRKQPPAFNLSTARVPTALFVGSHDDLSDPMDEVNAARELPATTLIFNQTYPDFSHVTWIAGTWSSFQAWFPQLKRLLLKYSPLEGSIVV